MSNERTFVFPPRRILVPLDLTPASAAAWKHAKSLAATFGASVEGLFVQGWVYQGDMPPMTFEVEKALAHLRRTLGAGEEIGAVNGDIEDTILSWGGHLNYDLIVMGSHGRAGLSRLILGSIAEAVVRKSKVPVMIVRRSTGPARTVLAPVNFEPYADKGLQAAAQVAQTLGARLSVLHVLDAPIYGGPSALKGPRHLLTAALNRLPEAVRKTCKPQAQLAFGDPAEQIAEAAKAADLVVLVAHRKGFLNDLTLGTTTDRLLRHSDANLLAVPVDAPAPPAAPRRRGLRTTERL